MYYHTTTRQLEAIFNLVDLFPPGCAAGGSFDWVKDGNPPAFDNDIKDGAAIKYAYGPELRPDSQADGGFIIPPENIYPSGEEIFAGVVASVDMLFPLANN